MWREQEAAGWMMHPVLDHWTEKRGVCACVHVHAFVAAGPVRLECVLIEQHLQQVDNAGPNTSSLLGTQFH